MADITLQLSVPSIPSVGTPSTQAGSPGPSIAMGPYAVPGVPGIRYLGGDATISAVPLSVVAQLHGSLLHVVPVPTLMGTFGLHVSDIFQGRIITAEPFQLTTTLTSDLLFGLLPPALTAVFGLHADVEHIIPITPVVVEPLSLTAALHGNPWQKFLCSFSLVMSLKLAGTLSLKYSLNVPVTGDISLLTSILQGLNGTLALKMSLAERTEVEGTIRLVQHLLDEAHGRSYGQFYFNKGHGL